jgi:hypothetical protein
MARDHFNPNHIEIIECRSRLLERGEGGRATSFEHTMELALGDCRGPNFRIASLRLTASGASAESLTQHGMARLFLDTLITALQRERADIRPGTPTPAGWGLEEPTSDH